MNFINWKTNKQKGLNFVLTLEAGGQKMLSLKYLKDRICKIKQYLNYILMIINQNFLAILKAFLNLPKKIKKNSTPSELPQLLILNLFRKFCNRKKVSN